MGIKQDLKKIIVLDRDGVINVDSDVFVKSADEWIPIPGSLEAIARLKQAGYLVAIATNQSGIGRGYISETTLAEMHQKLSKLLAAHSDQDIDLIVYCPHSPEDHCDCRKPKSGLIDQVGEQLNIGLTNSWMVGDSLRDLQAGLSNNMQPVLVRTGKGRDTELKGNLPVGTFVFDDLAAVVDELLD